MQRLLPLTLLNTVRGGCTVASMRCSVLSALHRCYTTTTTFSHMSPPPSILLATVPSQHKRLRVKAHSLEPTDIAHGRDTHIAVKELHAALQSFREKLGFGRAIAAPQIGHSLRMIALNLGKDWNRRASGNDEGAFTMYNPQITWSDPITFTMWDDCMSFPDMLYLVRRHRSVSVQYDLLMPDGQVETRVWEHMPQTFAELVQHEIDHLDGVLMSDRAIDKVGPITRQQYEQDRATYDAMADYAIQPTV